MKRAKLEGLKLPHLGCFFQAARKKSKRTGKHFRMKVSVRVLENKRS